jgi:hypothetical protein
MGRLRLPLSSVRNHLPRDWTELEESARIALRGLPRRLAGIADTRLVNRTARAIAREPIERRELGPSPGDDKMRARVRTPEETYGPALVKAQRAFPGLIPDQTAMRAAVPYEMQDVRSGRFEIPFFGTTYEVSWPIGRVRQAATQLEADITTRIILLHYLLTADGSSMNYDWIAFRNLPGGMGYDAAFQARANQRLAQAFGADLAAFRSAAHALGGESLSFGDASFMFRLLPRVWLAVVLHVADDEFPASANVLFDGAASHYLPTEDLAVLGGLLASRFVRSASAG